MAIVKTSITQVSLWQTTFSLPPNFAKVNLTFCWNNNFKVTNLMENIKWGSVKFSKALTLNSVLFTLSRLCPVLFYPFSELVPGWYLHLIFPFSFSCDTSYRKYEFKNCCADDNLYTLCDTTSTKHFVQICHIVQLLHIFWLTWLCWRLTEEHQFIEKYVHCVIWALSINLFNDLWWI